MATRTQTQQTAVRPQQPAPAPAPVTMDRSTRGERGLNCCMFIGRLGNDPEMKYTPSGIAVTTASLAVKSYPTAERPDWIRLRFWRGAAETLNEYGRKGSKLHVEGKLRVSSYVDKEGITRTSFVIDVDEFLFLGDPGHHGNGAAATDEPDVADLDGLDTIV
jgi:single-strand DNA-binding protein